MAITPWRATCIQMRSQLVLGASDRASAFEIIQSNLTHGVDLIDRACRGDQPPRLVVTPEFAFQGAPQGMAVEAWIEKACCPIPGPITAPLQASARAFGIYIAGNQFETDPEWPGRYFNTSFLIDPAGEVTVRYRRVTTAAFPSPHDFLDAYLARYSEDEVFPVADTELGRLALIPCSEISVPEVARVFMMRGAEVILHPTNSRKSHWEDAAKITRCAENKSVLISANVAGPIGFSDDRTELGGHSRIIDHEGRILAFDESADVSIATTALIDVEALRRDRVEDEGPSGLLRARWECYRPYFARASFYPPNSFLDHPMKDVGETAMALNVARRKFVQPAL